MWDEFGLQNNPYEEKAIEIGGIVPPSTFVGREEDRKKLAKIIRSSAHSLNLIVGDRGVGKTSLGNVVRSDLFDEYFAPLGEIDTQHTWTSFEFVEAALVGFYETSQKAKQHTNLPEKYRGACRKIEGIVEQIFFEKHSGGGGQAFGFGIEANFGKSMTKQPYPLLKLKFIELVNTIVASGYKGVTIQYNNLDNIDIEPKKLSRLFSDLRDFLVCDNVHFIVLGNKLMEEGIKYNKKVNECITSNFHIGALSNTVIKQALKKRYEIFKIPNRIPIPPITEDGVDLICELYEGNIRQIFYSLKHAVIGAEEIIGKTKQLNIHEVKIILNNMARKKIEKHMDKRSMEVLQLVVNHGKDMTNTEITKKLKLRVQNTSKYLKQLKDNNLIIQSDKIGRNVYYRAVHEAKWLLLKPEKDRLQTDIGDW